MLAKNDQNIFRKFRQGTPVEEIYKEFDIDKKSLIHILQHSVKGNYDYERIISGGLAAQKQFTAHLNSRWNPLEPDAPYEDIPAYIGGSGKKTPISEEEAEEMKNSEDNLLKKDPNQTV